MSNDKLVALYGHWIIAENIAFHLRSALLLNPGFHLATQHARRVWQSLVYVVVEGYLAVNARDPAIDALLADEELVSKLRRFRNATFHYQEDPLSPKILDFLKFEGWVYQLNSALSAFFERELPERSDLHAYVRLLRQPERSIPLKTDYTSAIE